MRKLFQLFCLACWLFTPLLTLAQDRTITGRVLSPKGDPIPLATVLIKGTNKSTVANEKGEFSIPVSGKNPVLVITAVNHGTMQGVLTINTKILHFL